MINNLFTFIAQHKEALALAGAWLVREAHNIWPFLKANGGLRGIGLTIYTGNSCTGGSPVSPHGQDARATTPPDQTK